jgi:biotin transport system substrate-specific component
MPILSRQIRIFAMASTTTCTDAGLTRRETSLAAQALWILGFAAATAVAARLEIPHEPVPYTLQTMLVLLAGAFLGPRNGALSQGVYLAAGVLGAPVFAGGALGVATLVGPTGGYLLAFPAAAAVTGYLLQQRRSLIWTILGMAGALIVIFASGTVHLYVFYLTEGKAALTAGFLIFTWWDLLKLCAAAMVYHELGKRWPRIP